MVNCLFETENNWVCFLALNLSSINVNMSLSIKIYLSATLPFYVFASLKSIGSMRVNTDVFYTSDFHILVSFLYQHRRTKYRFLF